MCLRNCDSFNLMELGCMGPQQMGLDVEREIDLEVFGESGRICLDFIEGFEPEEQWNSICAVVT